jgi:hypothetical protein
MRSAVICAAAAVSIGAGLFISSAQGAATVGDAITFSAGRLQTQPPQDAAGNWVGENAFTGPIVAGLVNGYQITGNSSYMNSAVLGGSYIMRPGVVIGSYQSNTLYNFGGEDVYGIQRLSDISADPNSNSYRTALGTYYGYVKNVRAGSTTQFITDLKNGSGNPSDYIASLAQYTVAANYVDAADKGVWRNTLMQAVADIAGVYTNPGDNYTPTLDFGIGLWGLAKTGSLDSTVINGTGILSGLPLSDLPGELLALQVPSGTQAGSFYCDWYMGTDTLDSGFTEDTAWSVSALRAAATAEGTSAYDAAINQGLSVLTAGVANDGTTYDHIYDPAYQMNLYAGETLIAVPEPSGLAVVMVTSGLLCAKRRK